MPRPSIDFLLARRAAKAASGGTQSRKAGHRYLHDAPKYAPVKDTERDAADLARDIIGAFSLWAETSRQVLYGTNEPETDIPF